MFCYIVNSSTTGFATDPTFSITEALEQVDAPVFCQDGKINTHGRSKERLAAPRRGFRDTLHVLRNLPGELAYTSSEVLYRGATCSASCN
jgi:hypothetical protein